MCGGHRHIRRNCPNKKEQQYVGSAKGKYGNRGPEAALALSSSIIIWGKVGGCPTKMLLDTGSAVTLIRQDVWEEITSCGERYQLEEAHRPIGVAKGDRLDTLSSTNPYWWKRRTLSCSGGLPANTGMFHRSRFSLTV